MFSRCWELLHSLLDFINSLCIVLRPLNENIKYAQEIVEQQKLKGGCYELQCVVYDALKEAPEEMHTIVNEFRCGADQPREEEYIKMFRSFVARRKLGESITFRQVVKEFESC